MIDQILCDQYILPLNTAKIITDDSTCTSNIMSDGVVPMVHSDNEIMVNKKDHIL